MDEDEAQDAHHGQPGFQVPWRGFSVGMGLIAAASVASLVVVTSVKDVDTLSTVALALAILAFAAQLVISVAERQASSQQLLQSERVNTETQALLADVRASTQGLHSTLSDQFDTVLRAALRPAIEEATQDGDVSPIELEKRITQHFDQAVRDLSTRAEIRNERYWSSGQSPSPDGPAGDQGIIDHMETYPDADEGRRLLEVLNQLTPLEVTLLSKRAQRELERRRAGLSTRWYWKGDDPGPATQALIEKGLFEPVSPLKGVAEKYPERNYVALSPLGRDVARLILAREPAPKWLLDSMRQP